MIVSIASGKGGTGKTTVAVNLALAATSVEDDILFLDCDVEEPNAHIFLKPKIVEKSKVSRLVPSINKAKCTYCGKCIEVCRYHALAIISTVKSKKDRKILFFSHLCHSCAACIILCPQNAIEESKEEVGTIKQGLVGPIRFIGGILNTGQASSTPLIRQVKAKIKNEKLVIIDAPPGTSCPMVASVMGSDFCILVTEPTPFGLHDLILAIETVKKLHIPFGVIINRSDVGKDIVEDYCLKENIPLLMKIPFERRIATAYSKGRTIVNESLEYKRKFTALYEHIKEITK